MKKLSLFIGLNVVFTFSVLFASVNIVDFANLEGEEYIAFAEEMPQPVGGLKAIYANVEYPAVAKDAGVQGKVYILAFINENGEVDDVKVIKGIGAGCDEAAVAAVKQAKFTPGLNEGKPVKVKYSLPIAFKMR